MDNKVSYNHIPEEIWNLLEKYMLDSNFIKFLIIYQDIMNFNLDIQKLEERYQKRHPKILWQNPSHIYPNVRIGIPYIEKYISNYNQKKNKIYHKKIEYLAYSIVETLSN